VAREVAREQLNNIDIIRQETADQIVEGARLATLKRTLERMELEDKIAEREAMRQRALKSQQRSEQASDTAPPTAGVARDQFAEFIEDLRRIPEVAKAAADVKAQIIKDAGGEEQLGEQGRQAVDTIDALLAAFVQKQAGEKLL
jgi:hypothetical protein